MSWRLLGRNLTGNPPEATAWAEHGFGEAVTSRGRWYCRPETGAGLEAVQTLFDSDRPAPDCELLKRTDERLVVGRRTNDFPTPTIVKARRQRRRRAGIIPRREPPNEMLQQLEAGTRGLPVPAVYGSGQIRDGQGQPWSVHIMRWLPIPCMRDRFLIGPSAIEVEQLLHRAGYSLQALWRAACNHVDFGPHAILMSDESPEADVIIDFEYATFAAQPSATLLAAQVGYFGWSVATNRSWATHDQIEQWLQHVFAQCDLVLDSHCRDEYLKNLRARKPIRDRVSRTAR